MDKMRSGIYKSKNLRGVGLVDMKTIIPIVIPVYEPGENFGNLICVLAEQTSQSIVVVDDGSGEEYKRYFDEARQIKNVIVLTHADNLGKGRSLKDAFNYILCKFPNAIGVITADSDGQHTIKDIMSCKNALAENQDCLILGCRTFDGEDIPWKSRLGNNLTTKLFQYLCGIDISDTQTGLRGIPRSLMYQCINNEPFIDKRILDFSQFAKKNLPGVEIAMVSNGTLLSIDKLDEIVGKIDEITINDYSEQYALAKSHKEIYRHVKKHNDRFKNVRIVINRRYRKEILATRTGTAPNKPKKNNSIDTPCIYPFLDLLIFPDGKVGMCCNDCKEITDFGDITQNSLSEIWNNSKFQKLREAMSGGYRSSYPFCKECDVVDAGEREIYIRQILKDEKKLQSQGR